MHALAQRGPDEAPEQSEEGGESEGTFWLDEKFVMPDAGKRLIGFCAAHLPGSQSETGYGKQASTAREEYPRAFACPAVPHEGP